MELAQKKLVDETPKTLDEMIPKQYLEFKPVFEKILAERFPIERPWDHAINLKPDFVPQDCKLYPLSPAERHALDKFIDENLAKGYIRPSDSPQASPFFFVGKKDGTLRPCQDYRKLNDGTIKDRYPLPIIAELIDGLKKATVFSKMDLRSGYNNVRIKDGDQWKAAFKTNRGLFEPMVMFFGLCNSPSTFQRMMNDLFKDMIDEQWMVIYMDDILIFSDNLELHRQRTLRVLERLKKNDLFLKPEKCKFEVTEVEFLGMIIKPGYIAMDPEKLNGIKDWKPPTTLTQLRGFMGFCNFYRHFIRGFSHIAEPLNGLMRKGTTFTWTDPCSKAFEELKAKFLEAPVLLMPNWSKSFAVRTDASKVATGAILEQMDSNGEWHPITYLLQSLSHTEQ